MEDIKNCLSELCGQKGILLTEKQLAQFQRYMELLVEWKQLFVLKQLMKVLYLQQ